jgi:signal transduction histidine kinase
VQVTTFKTIILTDTAGNVMIPGDRNRVEQVLINLLTNAIKYSPDSDKILVDVHNAEGSMICSVTDFGIGIAKESLPFVFDRFFREFDERSHSFPGLGLGLFISAEIIQRQNGKIWVTSTKGKGSTFSFSMPLQQHPPA